MTKKNLAILAGLMVLFAFASRAQEWECQNCPKRSIARFDLDVQVTEQEAADMGFSQAMYESLFMTSIGVFNSLMNDDPSRQCLTYYEGSTLEQIDMALSDKEMIEGGHQVSLPPPPGSLSAQYVLTGAITKKSKNELLIQVVIRAEETGEVVFLAEQAYDQALTGPENGTLAAAKIIPVMGMIRAFEKEKRDNDPRVVVEFMEANSGKVEIKPVKDKVKGQETIDVDILVTDCDGAVLKDLELKISAAKGTVDPQKIKTNESGEAKINYTAPCDPGNYAIEVAFNYFRPFEEQNKSAEMMPSHSETKEITVQPGKQFWMHYQHQLTQDMGGAFVINSAGKGVVVCTIDWESDPPTVTGTGMVVANWTGNADECIFSGRSSFKVDYEGTILINEGNQQTLEIRKTGEADMGGKFTIDCAGIIQEVPNSFPIPAQEEDRVLTFDLVEGATNAYDVPGTDAHYSYTLEMGCK